MGKTFISKLGSLLRVFKSGKKREYGKEKEDFVNITSESALNTSESSSRHEPDISNTNSIIRKSKSTDSLAIGTVDNGTIKVNELKKSNGACDILSNNKQMEIKCTKSLNRLCSVVNMNNNCVLSYYAKLHDSTIWSQAIGRVPERPKSKKSGYTSSSTIQVEEQECFQTPKFTNTWSKNEKTVVNFQELEVDRATYAKAESISLKMECTGNAVNSTCDEKSKKVFVACSTQKHGEKVKEHQIMSTVKTEILPKNKSQIFSLPVNEVSRRTKAVLDEGDPQMKSLISVHQDDDNDRTESFKLLVDEQKLQVKMDLKTITNEQGFDLLKYDIKSSGDHAVEPTNFMEHSSKSTDVIIDKISRGSEEQEISSKGLSDNTTEYEVVNLGHVDLFQEFKTTISKMRNVLNTMEVNKPDNSGSNKCQQKMNEILKQEQQPEDILTQTATTTINQICATTDSSSCNQTRNESVMVQLSSETTTKYNSPLKRITLDTNLLNYMKPYKKIRRRRKRGCRCRRNKLMKNAANNISSSQDGKLKTKMKPEKPHYNKCVVYHITQHKNTVDRCVGTPNPNDKEKLIAKNTFSAIHFGPINEFPMLLNKREHEIELRRKREEEEKLKLISSQNDQLGSSVHRRKSTSFLSSEFLNSSDQSSCLKSKTQPTLKCKAKKHYSSLSTSTATTNWVVFDPSPPLVMGNNQSTSHNLLLDKNRTSTQVMVSNILEEELKTSGLKGRISSSTMNLIKDQFCDKLSGMKSKDSSDVMITVCVPLKNIVSKIKTSRRTRCEDKAIPFTTSSNDTDLNSSSSAFEKGIQVNISKQYANDNLQTIPEKMSKKSTEIYQHNKLLRENMSSKRLSTFKKIFGNKATSCSNINPFGHLAPKTSRIYFSDHSTSSPDFTTKPAIRYAHKKTWTTPKSSTVSFAKDNCGHCGKNKKDGFFLNLPAHRYKRKREQISKLFDESDSSDRRYFGEPKLLYHVHNSSFYSTSKTDDKLSSGRILLDTSASNERSKMSYIPIQQVSSAVDINVKPKYISFCDLPRKCESEVQTPELSECPTRNYRKQMEDLKPNLKNADINTSIAKLSKDNGTQFENNGGVLAYASANEKKPTIMKTKKSIGSSKLCDHSVDEFSVVSLPKVHFQDDLNDHLEPFKNTSTQNHITELHNEQSTLVANDENKTNKEPLKKSVSILSLLDENNENSQKKRGQIMKKRVRDVQIATDMKPNRLGKQKITEKIHRKSDINLQTSSESNSNHMNQKKSGIHLETKSTITDLELKEKKKISKSMLKMASTQADCIKILPKMENCNVQVEASKEKGNDERLAGLIKDVVKLCNSSFVKSRDCIVELTLYNLIKEIILEHCSHLSEQSCGRIESILANFIKVSKQKYGNQDIDIVESAIENLVKEIGPVPISICREKYETEPHLKFDSNCGDQHEYKQRKRYSPSRSKYRGHKHDLNHQSHHKEGEEEHRGKHHHREEHRKHGKGHHKHHYHNNGEYRLGEELYEKKFRNIDGKKEYLELVRRLQELEQVTKQLSNVAQHQQNQDQRLGNMDNYEKRKNWFTEYLFTNPKMSAKTNMKFGISESKNIPNEYQKDPVRINYCQTEVKRTLLPNKLSKLPVTKIVINLSNLKLLSRNCVSLMSTSIKEPIVITDSTEEKRKLINKIISYDVKRKCRSKIRHSSKQTGKVEKYYIQGNKSEMTNGNKESFTITIHGKDEWKMNNFREFPVRSSKRRKDYMRIKMVRKKKTVTSTSDQTAFHPAKENNIDSDKTHNINQITKEYVGREYKLNSGNVVPGKDEDLSRNKCDLDQVSDNKGNLDLAYQRMANFCLFRGLLRKE